MKPAIAPPEFQIAFSLEKVDQQIAANLAPPPFKDAQVGLFIPRG